MSSLLLKLCWILSSDTDVWMRPLSDLGGELTEGPAAKSQPPKGLVLP